MNQDFLVLGASPVTKTIADLYDSTKTYSEGNHCTKNGRVYRANTDISVAEEWNESHWTFVKIADEIEEVKSSVESDISDINDKIGQTSSLNTTSKTDTVSAINEVNGNLGLPSSASSVTGSDAFSKIDTLNNNLTNVTVRDLSASEMTLPSGITLHTANKIIKCGKICIAIISLKLSSLSSSQYSIGSFIPSGFRPVAILSGATDNGLGDGKEQNVTLNPSGSLDLYPISTGTTYAMGSVAYICE